MVAICILCKVSGKVQGVFYRREACDQARARGLRGWIRNSEDGGVEAMICGEETEVLKMLEWLWQGPPAAKVSDVQSEVRDLQNFSGFEIKY